jgi:hypothetical protein
LTNNYRTETRPQTKENIVDDFLGRVRRLLPFWLKENEEQVNDILNELENHIWDRATDIASPDEPSTADIETALEQMGSPREIASEYKRRGIPKIYITEELFPLYQQVSVIVAIIILAVNVLVMAFSIGRKSFGAIVGDFFSSLAIGFLIEIIIVTGIFVYLSMEGFMPHDLPQLKFIDRIHDEIKWQKEREAKDKISFDAEASAKTEVQPTQTVTQVESFPSREATITRREKKKPKTRPKKRKKTRYDKYLNDRRENFGSGIAGIVFGILVIILPFFTLQEYLHYELQIWIALWGLLMLLGGIFSFNQALVGRRKRLTQLFMTLNIIGDGLHIPLFLALLIRPEILLTKLETWLPTWDILLGAQITVGLIISFSIISIIANVGKVIRLEVEGFPVPPERSWNHF